MAGGIDWFRWHHGSVTDGKFALVAHKAGASVAEVIAVWACLLEAASAAEDRGNPGAVDFEAMDFSLGMADGKSWRIYERMRERALLDGGSGRIASWEKRQPKRERTDDNSTERSRAFREKQRQAEPCNATQRQETPRGEESREEEIHLLPTVEGSGSVRRTAPPTPPPDFDGKNSETLNGKSVVPLAIGWELPEPWGLDAEALGWKPTEVLREAEKYRQYWTAGRGKGTRRSVKGWRQTWSTWLEKAARDQR